MQQEGAVMKTAQQEKNMKIQKSAEDYLEAMLVMREEHGYIRSIDLANHLGVTKPSVSYAVKRLRENGYVTMDKDKFIHLSDEGMEIADRIYTRHKRLTEFFTYLGVRPDIAREDACKIEHDISAESFKALCRYLDRNTKMAGKASRASASRSSAAKKTSKTTSRTTRKK